jgi:hypothetical protein
MQRQYQYLYPLLYDSVVLAETEVDCRVEIAVIFAVNSAKLGEGTSGGRLSSAEERRVSLAKKQR